MMARRREQKFRPGSIVRIALCVNDLFDEHFDHTDSCERFHMGLGMVISCMRPDECVDFNQLYDDAGFNVYHVLTASRLPLNTFCEHDLEPYDVGRPELNRSSRILDAIADRFSGR